MIFSKSKKTIAYLIVAVIILFFIFDHAQVYNRNEIEYGVTFSARQARDLGLDWKAVYIEMLDDLKVKRVRLPAYWNDTEPSIGSYNWIDLDWQIREADKRNVEIILAMGGRLPRWPECHWPEWAKKIDQDQREKASLNYIRATMGHYRKERIIKAWQIENEPFLPFFGECPEVNPDLLDKEIALARSLDIRPIVVTDSGELSMWTRAAGRADIFGTTMYRDTYSQHLQRYVHYPIGPWFFRIKKNLTSIFAHPQDWIIIELQAEPWGPQPFQNLTEAERSRTMDLEKLKNIIEFARQTGFKTSYLWGVEWWYWEKQKQNNPDIWNEAKNIFNNSR